MSYNAVRTWLKWLQSIYYCFPITPYSKKLSRALKKEAKYYLFDWSEISNPGARFENLIATHLKKSIDFWNDTGAGDFSLHYVRDLEKREVDFVILRDQKIWLLIECKLQDDEIPSALQYMTRALKPQHSILLTQEPKSGRYQVSKGGTFWVSGAAAFLQSFV